MNGSSPVIERTANSSFPKTYRISYRWQDRFYTTVMPHLTAYSAFSAAEIMIMPGAKAFAIAEVK
jgi:hypothetical protein